jgi:Zn-dependent protease
MRDSIRLGRLAGIPVGMHWSVLGVAALLTWSLTTWQLPDASPGLTEPAYFVGGVAGAGLFFVSLLLHELAHALVARRHGIGTEGITLWFLGGVARLRGEAPTARAEFRIAAAGPATSLLLGVVFGVATWAAVAAGVGDLTATVLAWLAVINVVLAVFNLLPGSPLDGGRILTAALWRWWGDRTRAAVASARAGQVLGAGLVALPIVGLATETDLGGLWTAVMGVFLWQSAAGEITGARARGALAGRTVRDVALPVAEASDWWTVDDLVRHGAPGLADVPLVLRDWGGRPSGLLLPGVARRVPWAATAAVRLRDLALRPDQVRTAWLDEPVLDALSRPGPPTAVLVAVDEGRIVAVVTADTLAAAGRGRGSGRGARVDGRGRLTSALVP